MAKMVIKSVAEVEKSRKRLRKILFFASLPVLALILFFAVKTAIIYINAQQVITLTEEGKYEEAVKAAQSQQENSFVDPWLAEYNIGVTQYNNSQYNPSITAFEKALTYSPPMPYICHIHNGLSKAYEKQGDVSTAEGKTKEAEQYYLLGKQTIATAPTDCFPPPPPPSEGEGEGEEGTSEGEGGDTGEGQGQAQSEEEQQGAEMQDTDKRLDEKLGESGEGEPQPEETDLGDEGKRDQIQEQMDQGNKDQQDDQNSEGGSGEQADKPW